MTSAIASYLADARRIALDEIQRWVPKSDPRGTTLYDLMLEYPLRDAKGLRPALCIATCRALGGGLEAVSPSAAVLELYHNAFLIHDDVEDGSELRRDAPTLHRQHGVPIAVNVGDAMLALALEPLLANTRTLGVGQALRILQVVTRMARETAEGQALELDWIRRNHWELDDADYVELVTKKTSWYSFIAPVMIGAIVGGASAEQSDCLVAFARELGIAFQIRDDVLNLGHQPRYGKEAWGDLWEGKRTLILIHALRCLDPRDRETAITTLARARPRADRESVRELVVELVASGELSPRGRDRLAAALAPGAPDKTFDDVAELRGWIDATRSIAYADALARDHAMRARALLDSAAGWLPPSVHRDLLHALVDFTIQRDY